MSHVVFYACPVRMVSKFLSPLRQAWHTCMIRVAYVKECMHLCRQADILLAWGGLCRLPFSKGKGWLDAPESKCPHAAPRPVILGEGLKEGGLFPQCCPSRGQGILSLGARPLLPSLPASGLRARYLCVTSQSCAPPSPLSTPQLRGCRPIWKEIW